jgi:hypothetical protein
MKDSFKRDLSRHHQDMGVGVGQISVQPFKVDYRIVLSLLLNNFNALIILVEMF